MLRKQCARWCSVAVDGKFNLESFKTNVSKGPDLEDFMESEATGKPLVARKKKPFRKERLPPWLKLSMAKGKLENKNYQDIKRNVRASKLATVCEEARCPNIGDCWGGGESETATATIMLMGDTCTRGCRFCAVKTSRAPPPLDVDEPVSTAISVKSLGVDYVVLTMVDRDDLPDGGAQHVASCISEIKKHTEGKVLVECLTGDFSGRKDDIVKVAESGLEVFAHNIEAVERASPIVRDRRANYRQSLKVLEMAKETGKVLTKSSIMLGFGERDDEIRQTLTDLRTAGVDCVTLGQYLQPLRTRMKVARYVHPDEFDAWRVEAEKMGFLYAASGPMVRSSYKAGEYYITNILRNRKLAAGA